MSPIPQARRPASGTCQQPRAGDARAASVAQGQVPQIGRASVQVSAPVAKKGGSLGIKLTHHASGLKRVQRGGDAKVSKEAVASMGADWKKDGAAHPSWAAKKAEGIVEFKGTKVTF